MKITNGAKVTADKSIYVGYTDTNSILVDGSGKWRKSRGPSRPEVMDIRVEQCGGARFVESSPVAR